MARQVGIVIGVAILVTVLGQPTRADALARFQHATVVLTATALIASAVALLLIRARARQPDRAAQPAGPVATER
jgi:hypothetical protein